MRSNLTVLKFTRKQIELSFLLYYKRSHSIGGAQNDLSIRNRVIEILYRSPGRHKFICAAYILLLLSLYNM